MEPSKRRNRSLVTASVGVALASLAFACNAVVGISDYERGECSGGGVCTDAGFPDAPIDVVPDAKRDAPPTVEAPGTLPVSWARFRMPNYPQDGGPTENVLPNEGYTATKVVADGDGLLDSITQLSWREPIAVADRGEKTWEEAQKICAGAWRLPSRIELVTLLDLSRSSGPKIAPAFASTEARQYWTSSVVRDPSGNATSQHWTVDFDSGGLSQKSIDSGTRAGVRCIKAK